LFNPTMLIVQDGAKLICHAVGNLISLEWWVVDGFCTERGV
jgi:hypothetical protein